MKHNTKGSSERRKSKVRKNRSKVMKNRSKVREKSKVRKNRSKVRKKNFRKIKRTLRARSERGDIVKVKKTLRMRGGAAAAEAETEAEAEARPLEALSSEFVEIMYNNMWQYMNLDVIKIMIDKLSPGNNITYITTTADEYDSAAASEEGLTRQAFYFLNDIGHYAYCDSNGGIWDSYTNSIFLHRSFLLSMGGHSVRGTTGNDGMCHGYALGGALKDLGIDFGANDKLTLTKEKRKENYEAIIQVYLFIIKRGVWKLAVQSAFFSEFLDKSRLRKMITIATETLSKWRWKETLGQH